MDSLAAVDVVLERFNMAFIGEDIIIKNIHTMQIFSDFYYEDIKIQKSTKMHKERKQETHKIGF